jgi:DNA-binding CsgD family transcriptional regulator
MHRERDRAAPVTQGRMLAGGIPRARFELLPGNDHLPYVGDADAITRLARRFLGLPASRRGTTPTLTPRQYEVAGLVTAGLTNRDIAARLHVTERSAESHVERIRIRLGFRSRSQIAAWFVASGG